MQTLKELMFYLVFGAIVLFVEVNFLHPEKYKSLCLFGYDDDEEIYDTIAVDTCVMEEIEDDDYPVASTPDETGIAASRDYLARGSAPALEGKICGV